ncbi:unnamed protein product [Vitrella brassicaformis CCMP3155]|uniref:DM2 domain-containing protein n=2 Tax=Vitrella brassicaformis TaxID=1169539 RepID=A0A0G4F4R0_VITBC|nr:unnamed protein product [Vitrella brassicaformis CCMP3155]|eukprot:CEM07064.1 unnamed protein product [Vitrella brassicaformis CCMP3155]
MAAAAAAKKVGGLHKAMQLSPALASFMGRKQASRIDVNKAIWAHIKQNNLQKEKELRTILPDAQLKPLLSDREELNMFELPRELNKHFTKLPEADK